MKKADKIDALKRFLYYAGYGLGGSHSGLCSVLMYNFFEDGEYKYLDSLLKKEAKLKNKNYADEYLWRKGAIKPRIKWINEQIKKLEKK